MPRQRGRIPPGLPVYYDAPRLDFDPVAFQAAMRRIGEQLSEIEFLKLRKVESSMRIANADQIRGLGEGDVILVTRIDTNKKAEWVCDGAGSFTCEGVTLAVDDFASAILNGNVSRPTPPPKVGDYYYSASHYYSIVVGHQGDRMVFAHLGPYAYIKDLTFEAVADVPAGWQKVSARDMGSKVRQGGAKAKAIWADQVASERLALVLETGVLPPSVEYRVRCEVNTATRTEVPVECVVESRWGCACDETEAIHVLRDEPRAASFVTLTCAPADGTPSPVHGVVEQPEIAEPEIEAAF